MLDSENPRGVDRQGMHKNQRAYRNEKREYYSTTILRVVEPLPKYERVAVLFAMA